MPRPLKIAIAALALAAAILAAAAGASGSRSVANRDAALRDGCQRPNFLDVVQVKTPEWVFVHRDPSIHVAEGISRVTHPATTDEPGSHFSYDLNSNLVLDRKYRGLLGGRRSARTNNFAGGVDDREEIGRLHYEWESHTLPTFAWPADGDRTKLWGSWIWDCGHWITDNKITGEHTEFHPLSAIVITRRNSYRARAGESETDAFISSDGTYAHSVEECARKGHPRPDGTYGPTFFNCARHHAARRQRLARSYSFLVRAPRRPAGAGALRLRTVTMAHSGRFRERVRRTSRGFAVTVNPLTRRGHYGRIFFARWSKPARAPVHLKVTLDSLLVNHADPDLSGGDPGGAPWVMYASVNGSWETLNRKVPALYTVHDGQRIALHRSFRINVQPGRGVSLLMMGTECDTINSVIIFGHFAPILHPCPVQSKELVVNGHPEDDPGTVLDIYRSPAAALGTHTTKSAATVHFPATGPVSFKDGKQGNDVYRLTYTVSRAR